MLVAMIMGWWLIIGIFRWAEYFDSENVLIEVIDNNTPVF